MKLQNILSSGIKLNLNAIAEDRELAFQIQVRLVALGLLHSTADGKFGPISGEALKKFQDLMKCGEPEFLGPKTAKVLIEAKPEDIPRPPIQTPNTLVGKIVRYMQEKNYQIDTGEKHYNIVYVEGMNADGTLNNDAPNRFNDRRMLIEIIDGFPRIVRNWEGTTEPGSKATFHPENPKGAARIKFGQYKSWQIGTHKAGKPSAHEALVQVVPVSVHRDFNKDFKRTGDRVDTGLFGINQHWGFDFPTNDIITASAGCLVGRTKAGHKEFMQFLKQDKRFRANRNYRFLTTIIPGDEL